METWAYCLMPNHLIVVPETKDGLNPAIGEAHRWDGMVSIKEINFMHMVFQMLKEGIA